MVCIRGAGKVGEKCLKIIEYSKKNDYDVCFADITPNKYSDFSVKVYAVEESIQKYFQGIIDFFIVPLEYSEEIRLNMISELIEKNVNTEHILLFPTKVMPCVKIDKLMNLKVFNQYYPHFWEQFDKSGRNEEELEIETKNRTIKDNREYDLILIGSGWLYNYVKDNLNIETKCESNKDIKKKVYVICDNSTYDCKKIFGNDKEDIYIFLYDFIMYFYFQNPICYYAYCKNYFKENPKSIVTGISYSKDAISHESIINLANAGQDLEHDFLLFKKYVEECEKKNRKLQNAVIGICPYSFRYSMKHSKVNQRQMLLYYPILGNSSLESDCKYFFKWFAYQDKLINKFLKQIDYKKCFYEYYLPEYGKVDYSNVLFDEKGLIQVEYEKCRENIRRTYNKPYEKTLEENKVILKDYIEYALRKGLNVFCLIPPYTEIYKREWKKEYLLETRQYLKVLEEKYEISVLDLADAYFPDWCFYDEGHLNAIGQKKVTESLLEYMENKGQ